MNWLVWKSFRSWVTQMQYIFLWLNNLSLVIEEFGTILSIILFAQLLLHSGTCSSAYCTKSQSLTSSTHKRRFLNSSDSLYLWTSVCNNYLRVRHFYRSFLWWDKSICPTIYSLIFLFHSYHKCFHVAYLDNKTILIGCKVTSSKIWFYIDSKYYE